MKSITIARYYPSIYLAKLSFAFAIAIVFALLLPQQLFAYSTTEQSAIQLTEDTFLFQITYRFNFMNRDSEHPVLAKRTTAPAEAFADVVQYDVVDASGASQEVADIAAVVVSETPVLDTYHYSQTDEPIFATLVALVKLTPEQVAAGGSAALKINWLPFTLIHEEEGERLQARVPAADLEDYTTPTISWQPTPIASQPHTLTTTPTPAPNPNFTWK